MVTETDNVSCELDRCLTPANHHHNIAEQRLVSRFGEGVYVFLVQKRTGKGDSVINQSARHILPLNTWKESCWQNERHLRALCDFQIHIWIDLSWVWNIICH